MIHFHWNRPADLTRVPELVEKVRSHGGTLVEYAWVCALDGNQMEDILDISLQYLNEAQARLKRDFAIGAWKRYDLDQTEGKITFSSDGRVGVVAEFQIVGSFSTKSNTWLWSWANPSVVDGVRRSMETVREYGHAHNLKPLTEAKWEASEEDGWSMTAIAANLLKADGAYRSPNANGAMFMVLMSVRRCA